MNIEDKIETIRKDLVDTQKIMLGGFKKVDENFEQIAKKINEVEAKVDKLTAISTQEFKSVDEQLKDIYCQIKS